MGAIYDTIGNGYDITRKADPQIVSILAESLHLQGARQYIDVACGTGNYTTALAARGGQWTAFDQSDSMLAEARSKSDEISWLQMDACRIKCPSGRFDGATCTLAIHHFPEISTPFKQIARILKSKSRFALFTAFPEQMEQYWLVEYFPGMMEKACRQMPQRNGVELALREAGMIIVELRPFAITLELTDFFLYSGKQRPKMYLSDSVRAGISSFRNGFCSRQELSGGLAKLESDIESGEITTVMSRYDNTGGDYMFVVAEKAM